MYLGFTPAYSAYAAKSRYPYTGAPQVTTASNPQSTFQYTSYWKQPTVAPQCTCHGIGELDQIGPALTAVSSLIGPVASLISGKKHYSPWGFLYDDYPMHIGENEQNIVALKNAINKIVSPSTPEIKPPPQVIRSDWQQSLSVMKQIVPQYVSGQESALNSNNRSLNEAGGGYERTFAAQIALIPKLQAQLQQAQAQQAAKPPAPASAVAPPPPSPMQPPPFQAPQVPYPTGQPIYQAMPASMMPSNISITTPGAMQAGMMDMGAMGPYLPYIVGGAAILLAVVLSTTGQDRYGRK